MTPEFNLFITTLNNVKDSVELTQVFQFSAPEFLSKDSNTEFPPSSVLFNYILFLLFSFKAFKLFNIKKIIHQIFLKSTVIFREVFMH
jgi:hypothetical protein